MWTSSTSGGSGLAVHDTVTDIVIRFIRSEWDHEANMVQPHSNAPRFGRLAGWRMLRALAREPYPEITLPGWDGTVLICGQLYRVIGRDMTTGANLIIEKVDPGNGA